MKELVKGIKFNFLGHLFRFGRTAFVLIASYLYGSENFGIYTIAWATADLLIKLGSLGLEQGLLFEISYLHGQEDEERLYRKIASSLKAAFWVASLEGILLAAYSYAFVKDPILRTNLYLLSPVIPINSVSVILIYATMGMKEMKYKVFLRDGLEPVLMVIGLFVFFVYKPFKPYGIVASQSLALVLSTFFSLFIFRKFFSWRKLWLYFRQAKDYFGLFRYSLPMYLIEISDAFLFRLDIFLISHFLGTGSPEQKKLLGVYGLAQQITRTMTATKNAFGPIFVPVTSESFLQNKTDELWKNARFACEKLLLLNVALALALLCFGKELLMIFGKDASLLDRPTFVWLLVGQFLYSTFSMLMYFLVVTLHHGRFVKYYFLILAAAPFYGSFFVQSYGARGAAITSALSYGLVSVMTLIEILRHHPKAFFSLSSVRILVAGFLAGLFIYLLKPIFLAHFSIVSGIVLSLLPGLLIYFLITLTPTQWRGLFRW